MSELADKTAALGVSSGVERMIDETDQASPPAALARSDSKRQLSLTPGSERQPTSRQFIGMADMTAPGGEHQPGEPTLKSLMQYMEGINANIDGLSAANRKRIDEHSAQLVNVERAVVQGSVRMDSLEESALDVGERISRSSELIVRGIPTTGDETAATLHGYVSGIARACRFVLRNEHILSVSLLGRKPTTDPQRNADSQRRWQPILVKFISEPVRREFFALYMRSRNSITTAVLNFDVQSRIFVSDNLTRRNEAIMRKALALKSQGLVGRTTVRHGLVVVTDSMGTSTQVASERDLDKIVGRQQSARQPQSKRFVPYSQHSNNNNNRSRH